MTSQSYQLMLRVGPEPGKVFELSKNELHIGRDVNNDIMINDAELSRRHARLVVQAGGGYTLEDLGSTNGTFVNGKRLAAPHSLQPGETIRFGDNVTLSYEIAGFDPNATVASGQAAAPAAAPVAAPPASPPPEKPAPEYAGQVPAGPDSSSSGNPLSKLMGNRSLLIGCAALLVVGACVAVAALWYIDSNSLWCNYFSFLFSACS